jgi:uncharacterized protein (DUF1015 family)
LSLIKPFCGLRPAPDKVADVVAPPYDVLNSEEARARAAGKPLSFLHISKPEIDLPADTDPYSDEVYKRAEKNLHEMIAARVLVQDDKPCYYAYRMVMGTHVQMGLVAVASVADYESNRIRKHEFTRPAKEDDRVRQIEAVNAQTGPVLLAYPDAPDIDDLIDVTTARIPDVDVTADDHVRHSLWVIDDEKTIDKLTTAFDDIPALYIADGHHRSAAAARICAERGGDEDALHRYFLTVIYPHHEMNILDYNRVVRNLNGRTAEDFLLAVGKTFNVEPVETAVAPLNSGEFGMYLEEQWYRLRLSADKISDDPVASLDVSLLSEFIIEPLLGISDPRTDSRIDFVGGIRGLEELEDLVDDGKAAVAFSLFPTRMDALMAVADAGEVMPPKSTWFEPKLADGLVSYSLK